MSAAQPSPGESSLGALGRLARRATLVAWGLALAWLTLTPVPGTGNLDEPMSTYCVICGDRGTADAILNVLLFTPLGLAFVERRRGALQALAVGTAISVGIEVIQLAVPGRYPTFGDVVWNGLGGAVGATTLTFLIAHLRAPRAWAGRAAAISVGGSLVLAGWLLGHAPTSEAYYGQWTADLGHMPQYEGALLSASLDGFPVPDTRFDDAVRAPERLASDWTISARAVKGAPPPAVSPILSVYDSLEAEILVLGAHGEDLVLRERTRAKSLLFDHPDLRLASALAPFAVGDTVTIGARREGERRCLSAGALERCGLGISPGRTWSLLLYLEGPPEAFRRLVDSAWLLTLLFAVGALSTSWRAAARNGVVVGLAIGVAVALTRLVVPPWWEVAAALGGLAMGRVAGRSAARFAAAWGYALPPA